MVHAKKKLVGKRRINRPELLPDPLLAAVEEVAQRNTQQVRPVRKQPDSYAFVRLLAQ